MRSFVKKILWGILSLVRNALNPICNFQETAILCYHSISDSPDETAITPAAFEDSLTNLKQKGYVFVSLKDIVAWAAGERALPRKALALTFDDGYPDFETAALPILKKFNAPSALFIIGDRGSRLINEPLVEVGYHSATHPNLSKLSAGDLEKEITPPFPARYFAYPGGNHSPQAREVVMRAGYKAAFTIRPVLVKKGMDPYLLPRSVVLKNMSPCQVVQRATKAADWYHRLTHLV